MKAANRCADLVVSIAGDVFHQEINDARIALQDMQNLQGAIAYFYLRLFRYRNRGLALCVTELLSDIFRQYA